MLPFLHILDVDLDVGTLPRGADHLCLQKELKTLLRQRPLERLGNLQVDAETTDVAQELNKGDL